MALELSAAFPASVRHVEHARLAEDLGYERVWFYDSPALYEDVWIVIALAAQATERVHLGPAVLVPDLRHVLVTASAIATVEHLAPGRLEVAVGTGFTGRHALGQRPLPWAYVEQWVQDLKALLRGEQIEVDGAPVQMIHPEGITPARPLDVPVIVAANGPKGLAVAKEHGDGVMAVVTPQPGFERSSLLAYGTVLDEGEALDSERVLAAAGPAAAVGYHGMYEADPAIVDGLPGGPVWKAAIEAVPERGRHLATHEGHFVHLTDRDRDALTSDASLVSAFTWTGTPGEVRARAEAVEASGCTEVLYAPMGPDVDRELRAFLAAAGPGQT